MRLILYATMVVLFAIWATVHLLLCLKLVRQGWSYALMGFIIPPLSIYYAQRFSLGKITPVWILSLSSYLVALTFAFIE